MFDLPTLCYVQLIQNDPRAQATDRTRPDWWMGTREDGRPQVLGIAVGVGALPLEHFLQAYAQRMDENKKQ